MTNIKSQYPLDNLRLAIYTFYLDGQMLQKKCGVWTNKKGQTMFGGYFTNSGNFVPRSKEGVYSSTPRKLEDRYAKFIKINA